MADHLDCQTIARIVRSEFDVGLASAPPRAPDSGGLTALDARVLSVLEIVAREFDKPLSVKVLAARLRLSPSRLEHLFKAQTGQGLKTFLRAARMTRAKIMLKDPTLRIKEVAAAVGYADVSHFTRDFRKQYGQSPSQSRSPSGSRFGQQIADLAK